MPKIRSSWAGSFAVGVAVVGLVALSGYTLTDPGNDDVRESFHSALISSGVEMNGPSLRAEDGAELYMTRCMSCHQMNGRGVPGVFPPLSGTDWVTEDKGVLIRIVLNGLTGEIKVGDEVYSGAMPPWQTFLNDQEMADLLTYIRQSWENDTTAVTPEEVAAVRHAVEDRKQPWTAEELMQEANRGIPTP